MEEKDTKRAPQFSLLLECKECGSMMFKFVGIYQVCSDDTSLELDYLCTQNHKTRLIIERFDPISLHNPFGVVNIHTPFDPPKLNYQDYIQSEVWQIKAKEARKRAGNRCQLCNTNGQKLHVHHRTYERLGDELPDDLTVLCEDCHAKFHNKEIES